MVYDDQHEGGEEEGGEEDGGGGRHGTCRFRDGVPRMGVKEEAGACRGRDEVLYAYSFSAPYPDLTREQGVDGGGGGGGGEARYLTVVQAGVVPGKEDGVGGGEVGQEESVDV